MDKLFNFINIPLGWVLEFISSLFGGNFAAAVFVFTQLINIVFIPLTIKSQKSSVQQMRIKPKLDELKKKYGDDRQKMAQAQQELYQKEGVSMAGGCLPMLVRLILMMSIYSLILSPLTYMARVDSTSMSNVYAAVQKLDPENKDGAYEGTSKDLYNEVITGLGWGTSNNRELALVNNITDDAKSFKAVLVDKT